MSIIIQTAQFSWVMQLVTGLISMFALFKTLQPEQLILREVLLIETIVQFIEFIFYTWLIFSFSKIKYNVTYVRYFDWMLTTPMMLISTAFYFMYNNRSKGEILQFLSTFVKEKYEMLKLIVYNFLMLLFGYLGERKQISKIFGFFAGFVFFALAFQTLYQFVGTNTINNYIFYIMFILWALYGIVYLFGYKAKNASYNILDIFSKNFYGLFISYVVFMYPSNSNK